MRTPMTIIVALTMGLATALSWGGQPAAAQTVTCTPITSLPFTINNAGPFCLTGNLSYTASTSPTSPPAITINHSGVVLDLNGYRLFYSGTTAAPGVAVLADNANVVVRNGLIYGFSPGVETSSPGTIIEDLRLDSAGTNGVNIDDGAEGVIVRRNYIRNAGLGVYVNAKEARIVDNDIYGATSAAYVSGVQVFSVDAFIVNNRFGRLYWGIYVNTGSSHSAKYRDNITYNVTNPYVNGTDIGNNN